MTKVLAMFSKLNLQEIPPLVYQLLVLSSKVQIKQLFPLNSVAYAAVPVQLFQIVGFHTKTYMFLFHLW